MTIIKTLRGRAVAVPAILALSVLVLSACSNVRETLGLSRRSPDEFTVVTKAPLVIPPDFTLRPPRPGEKAVGEVSARERARQAMIASARSSGTGTGTKARDILLGTAGDNSPGASKGELRLLAEAHASDPNPKIREILRQENQELAENRSFLEKLMFWRKPKDNSVMVDAEAEKRRLQTNAALGKKPNEGDVPMIKRKDTGLF